MVRSLRVWQAVRFVKGVGIMGASSNTQDGGETVSGARDRDRVADHPTGADMDVRELAGTIKWFDVGKGFR